MKTIMQLVLMLIALFPTQVAGAISTQEKLDRIFERQLDESTDRLYHQTHKDGFRAAQKVALMSTKKAMVANDELITISFPGWGSVEAAIRDYAVPRSEGIGVSVYQKTSSGFVDVKDPAGGNIPSQIQTIQDLNAHMRQLLVGVASGALTNQAVDKDKPFNVFVTTVSYSLYLDWVYYLYLSKTFSLIKGADGSYHLPDFSNFELGLVEGMVYPIPHATRVIGTLVYNEAKTNRTGLYAKVLDSDLGTIDPKYDYLLEPGHEYVNIPTGIGTRGTNQTTVFNLMVIVDHKNHYAIGPMGKQSPFIDDVRFSDSGVEIDVTAAINSALTVEAAQSLTGSWAPFGDLYTPTPSVTFKAASCGPIGFYRIRTAP